MRIFSLLVLFFSTTILMAQEWPTPAQVSGFQKTTSYDELSRYVQILDSVSDILSVETIGQSVEGRNIYAMKFSNSVFGKEKSKIKVLIFAQQHGNEQSGKEGALLLATELLKPQNRFLLEGIDFALIPQMNPDGSEQNKRRNGHDMDLNRNHLILTEPETQALHVFFDKYLFEVNMDVHEYFPFGETWKEYGYRNNSDILMGVTTNINVSKNIRELSLNFYLPHIKKYLDEKKVSNFVYSPGGPPEIEYIRHSTFDINDGRQSFGIQNTFSFIQEGMNGTDSYVENLEHRAMSQMYGMMGLLEFSLQHKKEIKTLVKTERESLVKTVPGISVSIQNEHVGNGNKLELPVFSYWSSTDTIIKVEDYRPVVKSIYDVLKPAGYLIPKTNATLCKWVKDQGLVVKEYERQPEDRVEQYTINAIDSIDFEGDIVINPTATADIYKPRIKPSDYLYIPCNQLKGNLIVIALEPKSMLGLATYKQFAGLVVKGQKYGVLRVVR